MPTPLDTLLAATADFAASCGGTFSAGWDESEHPRGGFPENRGEFSPAGKPRGGTTAGMRRVAGEGAASGTMGAMPRLRKK